MALVARGRCVRALNADGSLGDMSAFGGGRENWAWGQSWRGLRQNIRTEKGLLSFSNVKIK